MDRQWIYIKGRRIMCTQFIYSLDAYRASHNVGGRGRDLYEKYCSMICVLQEITDEYTRGRDCDEIPQDFYERYHMDKPIDIKLPAAIGELFEQMENRLHLDLSELLDNCVESSTRESQRLQELQRAEEERRHLIETLMEENRIATDIEDCPEKKVYKLLLIQKAKLGSSLYEMNEDEINTAKVWCDLLISSMFSEVISYGTMLRLVENKLVEESEISDILEDKYDDKRDYEWYSEDFIGCGLDEPTIIKIQDIMEMAEPRVMKIIGTEV